MTGTRKEEKGGPCLGTSPDGGICVRVRGHDGECASARTLRDRAPTLDAAERDR